MKLRNQLLKPAGEDQIENTQVVSKQDRQTYHDERIEKGLLPARPNYVLELGLGVFEIVSDFGHGDSLSLLKKPREGLF
jgi:hypothetical protein